MSEKKHWWQEQPLTISAIQCGGDGDEWILDEYVAKGSFTVEQLYHPFVKGEMAYYYEEKHGKKLDAYLKKSHEHGVRQIIYQNTHCIDQEISDAHPEWLQRTKDASPMRAYSIYHLVCVNPNGAWHQNFLKEMEALCQHDIDGIFLDGPVMRDDGCYCEVCRRDFERRYGHPIEQGTRIELHDMRLHSVTEHVRETYELVKRINPEIALYLNNSALRADVTGNNTRRVYEYVDLLGAEGGFHCAAMGANNLWPVSTFSKYLEGVTGDPLKSEKPVVCFFSGNESGISYYMHTPAETLLTYAQGCANGSNIWYGVHFPVSEFKDTASAQTALAMNRFVLEHRDVYAPSRTCARVALIWSQCTANHYASSVAESDFTAAREAGFAQRGDHRSALMAIADMLIRSHIQFDILDEAAVDSGALVGYEAVILPSVACLSDETAQKLEEYVRQGGNLLGNFDVGMYHEDGSFAGRSKLTEVFGLVGEPEMLMNPSHGQGFIFRTDDHPMLERISFHRFPGMLLNAAYQVAEDVRVLAEASRPLPSYYAPIPEEGRYPAITEHNCGAGRAFYLCGTFGETAQGRNISDYIHILRGFCDAASRPVVISDAAGLYETVLRRQENRFILHIINLTGAMNRPVQQIVPLYGVEFTLQLADFGIEPREFALTSLREAHVERMEQQGATLRFALSKIGAYEVIVIE